MQISNIKLEKGKGQREQDIANIKVQNANIKLADREAGGLAAPDALHAQIQSGQLEHLLPVFEGCKKSLKGIFATDTTDNYWTI